jgi:hypothetical protein
MSSIFSIYIPRIKNNVTDEYINYVFCQERIGSVVRVDFTSVGQKPGFKEIIDDVMKSAFVYLILYNTPESVSFNNKVGESNGHRVYLNGPEKGYWIVLPNKNPIQFTMMNNSQIVDNCRYLEKQIDTQSKKLEEQETAIQKLTEKLDGVQAVVYQLIGGLFNHKTQGDVLEEYIKCLFTESTKECTEDELSEKNRLAIFPTTRQGDCIETKIEQLERKIDLLTNGYVQHNYLYDDETVSTSSSINDNYETVLDTRRSQMSRELCGNE